MAYDRDLAERLRVVLGGANADEKAMFGGLAFLIGGHLTVTASRTGGLLVRVDPAEAEALLAQPGVEDVDLGGRGPMKGWLRVAPAVLADDDSLATWVERAVRFTRSLPAKTPQRR